MHACPKTEVSRGFSPPAFCAAISVSTLTINMDEGLTWANLFFSDNPPEFIGELDCNPKFRPFSPDDEQWRLGGLADKARLTDASKIQVFWLLSHGRRKYVGKVVSVHENVFEGELTQSPSFPITLKHRLWSSFAGFECQNPKST